MKRLHGLLILLALAACAASGGVITYVYEDSGYSPSEFAYAGGPGELRTVIMGNPFNAPQPAVDRAITGAMYRAHFGPATRFTTTPGPNARRAYHVVILLNGPETNSMSVCGGVPPIQPAYRGGGVLLFAAFCRGDYALTFLRAAGDGFGGPDDPKFRAFIQEIAIRLFPPDNESMHNQDHDRCTGSNC